MPTGFLSCSGERERERERDNEGSYPPKLKEGNRYLNIAPNKP